MTATEFLPVNGCLLHGMEAPIDLRIQKQSKVHCGGEACPDQGFQQLDVARAEGVGDCEVPALQDHMASQNRPRPCGRLQKLLDRPCRLNLLQGGTRDNERLICGQHVDCIYLELKKASVLPAPL